MRLKQCHEGRDESFDTFILDEDKVRLLSKQLYYLVTSSMLGVGRTIGLLVLFFKAVVIYPALGVSFASALLQSGFCVRYVTLCHVTTELEELQ